MFVSQKIVLGTFECYRAISKRSTHWIYVHYVARECRWVKNHDVASMENIWSPKRHYFK